MIALEVHNTKEFMSLLLTKEVFDSFHLEKADITTYLSHSMQGGIKKDYFGNSEDVFTDSEKECGYVLWKREKAKVLSLIKGENTPLLLNLTLRAGKTYTEKLLGNISASEAHDAVSAFLINIRYEKGTLRIFSAISYNSFIISKQPEEIWDKALISSFESLNMNFTVL